MTNTAYAAGSTGVEVYLSAFTSSTGLPRTDITNATAGLTLAYTRVGQNNTTFAPAAQTASGAYTEGGFVHVGGGLYRIDVPNAAFLAGADFVVVHAYGVSDCTFSKAHVDIVVDNPRSSAPTTTQIRDAILSWEPYTGYNLARLLRAMGIVFRGTLAGARTGTETFTAPAGGATVTATTDVNGNRTVVSDTASGTP